MSKRIGAASLFLTISCAACSTPTAARQLPIPPLTPAVVTIWKFAAEPPLPAERLPCRVGNRGQPTDDLVEMMVLCKAALAGRDAELNTWENWAGNERKAHEELGHGQINH